MACITWTTFHWDVFWSWAKTNFIMLPSHKDEKCHYTGLNLYRYTIGIHMNVGRQGRSHVLCLQALVVSIAPRVPQSQITYHSIHKSDFSPHKTADQTVIADSLSGQSNYAGRCGIKLQEEGRRSAKPHKVPSRSDQRVCPLQRSEALVNLMHILYE